jgi:hypothetical protein
MSIRIGVGLLTIVTSLICLELGDRFGIPGLHSVIPTAEAVVGRPLTPVSYAGVARRTSRRCEAGVYNC